MSNKRDYATGIVAVAPSPTDSGTSLELQAGQGDDMPATPFFATAHAPTDVPDKTNAEKIQVTDVTGDVLTIVRAQGETSAQDIDVGWRISNAIFTQDFDADQIPYDNSGSGATAQNVQDGLDEAFSGIDSNTTALGTKVPSTRTVNGHALSSDVTLTQDDVGDGTTYKQYSATDKSKLAGIEAGADVTDATNVDAAGATMNSDTNVKMNSWVKDEDTMSSNDDTKVPTQQSVKAYVDAAIAATKAALYPVGSIYANADDSTNPATLLGFGTWVAFSKSRMMIGAGQDVRTFNFATTDVNTTTDVITVSSNLSLYTGQAVTLSSSGTLPGGLSAGTYYIIRVSATTVKLASSRANAVAGTAIDLTSTGSGTHTITLTLTSRTAGDVLGEENHTLAKDEMPVHNHTGTTPSGEGAHSHRIQYIGNSDNMNVDTGGGVGGWIVGIAGTNNGQGLMRAASDAGNGADPRHQHTIPSDGTSNDHNNMSPAVVVYLWRRTA